MNIRVVFLLLSLFFTYLKAEVVLANFTCDNGDNIPIRYFCNGENDCDDGSDERTQVMKSSSENQDNVLCLFLGNKARLSCPIPKKYICEGIASCQGLTPCDVGCASYYHCAAGTKCFQRSTICDGDSCNGCPEDIDWGTGIGFKCVRNGKNCVLPQQLLHDDIKDCDGGEDICYTVKGNEKVFNKHLCFRCLQSNVIIPRLKVCNRVFDCPDLSDECVCEGGDMPDVCNRIVTELHPYNNHATCKFGDVRCRDGTCINRFSICDGKKDCFDAMDERYEICGGTLNCRDGNYITANEICRCDRPCKRAFGTICNGVGDCPVPFLDGRKWLKEPGFPDDECKSRCSHPNLPRFSCTTTEVTTINKSLFDHITCEIKLPSAKPYLPPPSIHKIIGRQLLCDGVVDCPETQEDESIERCPNRFRCRAGHLMSIPSSKVCDGFPDCDDISDEVNKFCEERLFCPSLNNTKISIDRKYVCDFNINCDDASDELHCKDDRFYCEDAGLPLFVRRRLVFDGRKDCKDWSDECPTTTLPPNEDMFSSRYELIANPVLRALVWIMGIVAISGNTCVIFGESRRLYFFRKKASISSTLLCNHVLVLNLAISDLLMGIYLISLGIAGLIYSGSFCAYKMSWLSGAGCSIMGLLVITSSQSSVITMILLTSFRLYAVFQPFQSANKPSVHFVFGMIILQWTCSLLVATLPLTPFLRDFFADKALLFDNPFFQNIAVDFTEAKDFVKKIQTFGYFSSSNATHLLEVGESWSELKASLFREIGHSEYLTTSRWIGYYSANSVCIPNLFITPEVDAWSYSFAIILFNFLSFIFVTLSYIIIFLKSKRNAALPRARSLNSLNLSKTLQRRIIRLIVTDFCCWVPISIMTFLNFAGLQLSDVVYVISAVILLPINSALNPVLYSNFLDKYVERAWKRTKTFSSKDKQNSTFASSLKTSDAIYKNDCV